MGVQGLWELLTPIGRRVSVDSLGNRKLAIDASIWIIQFMKAMRDENGDMVRNAHLLGFFRRICKLLFLRIKPVFVFDGGTPLLKRRTVIARRKQRESAQFKIRKTAEKLLLNHIRSRKLEELASEINSGPRKPPTQVPSQVSSQVVETDVKPVSADAFQTSPGSEHQLDARGLSFRERADQEAADALLAASLAAEDSQSAQADRDPAEEIIEASDGDDDVEELVLPSTVKGLDPAVLASLPASMQLELLVQMREQLVAENRQKFQKVSKVPASFSQLQIQAYLKTVAFRREITEVQRASGGVGVGGVPTTRIASTSDREFIFSNSFQGEKPAPSTVEKQRRGRSGVAKEIPGSFLGSKSTLFSSMTETQKSPLEVIPEEGVVSLVSTQLSEEPDTNSNSSVHTYVDDRGHVRVSRVRGMGVRMTRDLQWNLYLMKDTEARKTSDNGLSSEPPIIPSNFVADSPTSTVNNVMDCSASQQGLQISFVDDGNSDFSKDGDLFEELVMLNGKGEHVTNLQGSSFPATNKQTMATITEEDEDYEWEEGGVEKSLDCCVVEEKAEVHQVLEGSTLASTRENESSGHVVRDHTTCPHPLHIPCVVPHKEYEEGQDEQWDDGGLDKGVDYSVDYSVVEDKDLAEAMKLSLMMQDEHVNTEEPNDHIIIEDGPSSDESEVEWEDGTGAVTVTGFDAVSGNTDTNTIELGPSEEAQIQEAIRRSLEDFCPPAKMSARLVIKEPSEDYSSFTCHLPKEAGIVSPLQRAEEESEEVYLARERTRKGKALLGEEENVSRLYASNIPKVISEELEHHPDATIFKACNEDALQTVARVIEKNSNHHENQVGEIRPAPSIAVKAEPIEEEHAFVCNPVCEQVVINHGASAQAISESVLPGAGGWKVSPVSTADTTVPNPSNKNTLVEQSSAAEVSYHPSDVAAEVTSMDTEDSKTGILSHFAGTSTKAPVYPSESLPTSEAELLRDAEEMDIAKEREELRLKEAQLHIEREQLAREEEELQAELQAEREEILAGLDRERELLEREEMELRATKKKNERNAESVTSEMFTDVQELLQLFGLPYVVAPMEAEAQCAFLDTINLVDGVVTEDSDVFLFGGRNVYKNLFDDRKYVETYYMKDLESEMGMTREKLIRMALLLGSDYTEGISGIGIVNAIEVVNAFEEEDGLQRFKAWLDSPDMSLFNQVYVQTKVKGDGKVGRAKGKALEGEGEHIEEDEVCEGGDLDETEDSKFTPRQRIFISKHRVVSKNWHIPDSFPSEAVVSAYISPMVDKSKETFSFGRPDLEALRRFCYEKFSWGKDKADELLLPVLKEHDRRETQTRMDSYYHFSQRFAKIRSRRIQKAVTGITGRRSDELMDLPPHLVVQKKSTKKRSNITKTSELDDEINRLSEINQMSPLLDEEPATTEDGAVAGVARVGRGRRGRGRGRGQHLSTAGEVEDEGNDGEDVPSITNRKSRGRGRGRARETGKSSTSGRSKPTGRGRGRGKGKARENVSEADASASDEVTEDLMGEVESLKRKASQTSQALRRSTRPRSEVNYMLENSDEEACGACSDGEELQASKQHENATMREIRDIPYVQGAHASSSGPPKGVSHMDLDRPVSDGPSKEYEVGGGFCREDGEGCEEAGQLHFEMEEPAYLASGGGFCMDEEEETPKDFDGLLAGDKIQEQQQGFTLEDGFCLAEDEEEALARASEIAEENYLNQLRRMESQEQSRTLDPEVPSVCSQVTDDVSPPVKQLDENGEALELGLRAMPLMRRKKRKSG
ncbi:DNA excision repair protein ERCC-5 [Marchantia polymorpha subsp. ruderalis]